MKSSLNISIFEKFLERKFLLDLKKTPVSLKCRGGHRSLLADRTFLF